MRLNLPKGKYRFVALANQKELDKTIDGQGAKYRRSEMHVGDDISLLQVKLDRASTSSRTAIGNTVSQVNQVGIPLDTLWHAISSQHKTVTTSTATADTLSLMRNTKNITLSLRQIDDQANITDADYEVYILDNNGTTNYDNSVAQDEDIQYTPHDSWTTAFSDIDCTVIKRTDHYCITCNRLILYTTPADNTLLVHRLK